MNDDYIYDIETFPTIFTFAISDTDYTNKKVYEISTRKNQGVELYQMLQRMEASGDRLVGFNNTGFDWLVVHYMMTKIDMNLTGKEIALAVYNYVDWLINTATQQQIFNETIWWNAQTVKQIDLYKIHHFDNAARRTSLKVLQFNMRMENIEDLPFEVGTYLEEENFDDLIDYNFHDIDSTAMFYRHSLEKLEYREELSLKYNRPMMNDSDMKIGKNYFIMRLEERLGPEICFRRTENGRQPNQTLRDRIIINDILFPYINFENKAFRCVHEFFKNQIITDTKGAFSGIPISKIINDSKLSSTVKRGSRVINLSTENLTDYMDTSLIERKLKSKEGHDSKIKNLHCVNDNIKYIRYWWITCQYRI